MTRAGQTPNVGSLPWYHVRHVSPPRGEPGYVSPALSQRLIRVTCLLTRVS